MYEAFYIANLFYLMNKTKWNSNEDEYYVISQSWFDKWKLYTNYDFYMTKTSHLLGNKEDDKNFFNNTETYIKEEVVKQFESTYLIGNSSLYPGPVNNYHLLYEKNQHLSDEETSSITNFNIKENLMEGIDFIIVSKSIWSFFHNVYGGFEIKRYSLRISPTDNVVEIKLKNVIFLFQAIDNNYKNKKFKNRYA